MPSLRTRVSYGFVFSALLCALTLPAAAQSIPASGPALTISPSGRTDLSSTSVPVTITGSAGTFNKSTLPTFAFTDANLNPTNMVSVASITVASDTTVTATFTLKHNAWGIVTATVNWDGKSSKVTFDTGVYCLEAIAATGCALRWEVDTSGVNGSSSQTGKNTVPNIMFKLDFQWAKNKDTKTGLNNRNLQLQEFLKGPAALPKVLVGNSKAESTLPTPAAKTPAKEGATSFADRFTTHLFFKAGYTQVTAKTTLQSTSNSNATTSGSAATSSGGATASGNSAAPATCTGTAVNSSTGQTAPSTCTAATPQQAFVAEGGGTIGWTFGQNGQDTFAEVGLGARGSIQDLLQSNQVVQSGGISYVDLSSLNPRNVVGLYEGVFRFRVASLGHDAPAAPPKAPTVPGSMPTKQSTDAVYKHNASDLLVFEAGYQNNSGLAQLAGNPMTNTRNRFVGRFYAYPELPGPSHTKILVGMEYSGGIDGGPKVIQVFFGANVNPLKLLTGTSPSKNSSGN